jgi:hypothetical protein
MGKAIAAALWELYLTSLEFRIFFSLSPPQLITLRLEFLPHCGF